MYSRKMVKKLKHIIIGWWKHIFQPMPIWAKKRLEKCDNCLYQDNILGQNICSKCGCVCRVKVLVEDEICYDGRWNDIKINEYDK